MGENNMKITGNNATCPEKLSGYDYDVLIETADYHAYMGNYNLARTYYYKAILLEPYRAEPYLGLGTVALENKSFTQAERAFEAACQLDSKHSKAYCGLGIVYQRMGELEKSFEMYSLCLEIDKDNIDAILGLFQVGRKINRYTQIRTKLQMYLQIHPNDVTIMFCLANVCVKEHLYKQANNVLLDILLTDNNNIDAINLLEEIQHRQAQQNN